MFPTVCFTAPDCVHQIGVQKGPVEAQGWGEEPGCRTGSEIRSEGGRLGRFTPGAHKEGGGEKRRENRGPESKHSPFHDVVYIGETYFPSSRKHGLFIRSVRHEVRR